jgi:hypothetical protein
MQKTEIQTLNFPITNLLLKDINFSQTDKQIIDLELIPLKSLFNKFNIPFLTNLKVDHLNFTYSFINEILNLKENIINIGNSSFKIDRAKEYQELIFIIDILCPYYLSKYKKLELEIKKEIHPQLKKMISNIEYINKDMSFNINNYTNMILFSNELDQYIRKMTIENLLNIELYFDEYVGSIFETIRYNVLFNNYELKTFLENHPTKRIHMEELELIDPVVYELLRGESFKNFCSKFDLTISAEDSSLKQLIKPNSKTGQLFHLNTNENLLLEISTNYITNFNLKKGTKVHLNKTNDIEHLVCTTQEFHKELVLINHQINDNFIQIQLPIYFSFQKMELSSKFSSKGIKFI